MSRPGGTGGGVSGTIAYQAPELLLQKVTEASRKAEIHTFGIVVTGEIPRRGKGPIQLNLLAQDDSRETMFDNPETSPGFRDRETFASTNGFSRGCSQCHDSYI